MHLQAYPSLMDLMPVGLKGLVFATFLAAVGSAALYATWW